MQEIDFVNNKPPPAFGVPLQRRGIVMYYISKVVF
jgi:hypothetical protein